MSEHNQIKRATELLVKSLGGIEAAAPIIGKGKSTVGRWTNKNDDESINVLDLRELEANADAPLVTAVLARLAGGVFIPLPQMPGSADALPMQVMELAKELGELSESVRQGLGDGSFDAADAQKALDELHDVERCTARLRLALSGISDSKVTELRRKA